MTVAKQLGPNIRAAYVTKGTAILVRASGGPQSIWTSTGTVRGSRRLVVTYVQHHRIGRRRAYIFHGFIDGVDVVTRAFYGQNALTMPGPGYVDGGA